MTEKKVVRYYQKLSDNVYRISGTVRRDAVTGRYNTDASGLRGAKKLPSTTHGQI